MPLALTRAFTAVAVLGLAVWLSLMATLAADAVAGSGLPGEDGGLPWIIAAWAGLWAAVVFGTLALTPAHPRPFAFKRLRRVNLAALAVVFFGLLATVTHAGTTFRIVFLLHGIGAILLWWWHGREPIIQSPASSNRATEQNEP